MAHAPYIVALALAALQPSTAAAQPAAAEPAAVQAAAAPPAAGDPQHLLALFDRVCVKRNDAPAGFRSAQWSDFPKALVLMNTYDHGGTFLRSETPSETYIARTQGGGHMAPGLETRCGVAGRLAGADVAGVVSRLAESSGAKVGQPVETSGVSMHMLIGDRDAVTVYQTADDWVIIRNLGILIPANMVKKRDLRRKGKRD